MTVNIATYYMYLSFRGKGDWMKFLVLQSNQVKRSRR